jgi:hypothetical protein
MKRIPRDEQRVNLLLWYRNGTLVPTNGRGRSLPELSVGRTDSRRGLGFQFRLRGKKAIASFVLDREQMHDLQQFLLYQRRRVVRDGGAR